ncbi:hypothetical protein N9L02_00300 [Gammaproteobacteria bacterium]|nr:hypothetical protein [Gammaproteobacteria bacterium]
MNNRNRFDFLLTPGVNTAHLTLALPPMPLPLTRSNAESKEDRTKNHFKIFVTPELKKKVKDILEEKTNRTVALITLNKIYNTTYPPQPASQSPETIINKIGSYLK